MDLKKGLSCLALSLICLITGKINAQTHQDISSSFPVIDSLINQFVIDQHVPGFALGIVYQGELVYSKNIGFGNLEEKIPVNANTAFRIASMSKSFAAAAVLHLRDVGKIRLDDPVEQYIPELKGLNYPTADAPRITIRHLLTHTAGFPEDNPWGDRQLDISKEEFESLLKEGFSFSNAPGVAYEYSNTGFAILGYLINKVSGLSYNEYINRHILKPLGMTDTYWEYDDVPKEQLAIGYRWLNEEWEKQPMLHDGAYGVMGGLISSVGDFSKYLTFHLRAWPARDEQEHGPLKRASIREMHQPWSFNNLALHSENGMSPYATSSAYGYGLRWNKKSDGKWNVGHSGGLPGFGSNWMVMPDYGLGIVSFGNVTYAGATGLNTRLLDTLIQVSDLLPRKIEVNQLLIEKQAALIGFLPKWEAAEESDLFAVNFFADYLIDSLRKEAIQLFETVGTIDSIGEFQAENSLRGSFILHGRKGDLQVNFTLSPERNPRIQAYRIRRANEH